MMVSWVDDILALEHPEDVKEIKQDLAKAFTCKCEGETKEYNGRIFGLMHGKNALGTVKISQPVLVQKLEDVARGKNPKMPAVVGQDWPDVTSVVCQDLQRQSSFGQEQ